MSPAIEQGGNHPVVTDYAGPLAEVQAGRDICVGAQCRNHGREFNAPIPSFFRCLPQLQDVCRLDRSAQARVAMLRGAFDLDRRATVLQVMRNPVLRLAHPVRSASLASTSNGNISPVRLLVTGIVQTPGASDTTRRVIFPAA